MNRKAFLLSWLIVFTLFLSACASPTPTASPEAVQPTATEAVAQPTAASTEAPSTDVLYVNIIWHQHQPLYYKDENGVYTRPWVRVHATKDYYDMAAMVAEYPNVHVTFNLTPVLIRQLDDFANNGAKDLYWVLAEKPADQLTVDEKRFILTRFFDANWDNVIGRFPRYKELLNKRGGTDDEAINRALETFSEQDFRDLQIWFNLAWFDPDLLAQEPLKSLVEKGRDFSEDDKVVLFDEVRRVIQQVIPLHRELQEKGQIEVITTPYAHPILPLIYDTNLALVGDPGAEMPAERFSYPNDAIAHLEKSVQVYEDHFGQPPKGLWPGEGAVAQQIVPLVARAGYQWMATGEPVLAASLGIGSFTRDLRETVQEADDLYRPYYVVGPKGEKVAVFFRDWTLSDKLGFTYSGMPGDKAAQDLIHRLENIRARLKEQGADGPHVVSIILDGENAWEYYKNDGKDFFHALYGLLSESTTLKTVTPSEYLSMFPEQRTLEDLFPGAWFSQNYDTWIGETEERIAWEYLARVRFDLSKYDMRHTREAPSEESLQQALDYMYLAEGSDWFWWYGADQDSGQDEYFDQGFRTLLAKVYESLGEPVPTFVNVPIIPKKPVAADRSLQGLSTPDVDGAATDEEWAQAAYYRADGTVEGLWYALDAKNLYLRVQFAEGQAPNRVGFYLTVPRLSGEYPFARAAEGDGVLLGVAANKLFEWAGSDDLTAYDGSDKGWQARGSAGIAAANGQTLEVAIPLEAISDELEAGDDLRLLAVAGDQIVPAGGPAQIVMPDLGLSTLIFEVNDPEGDDHGPGSYTYPTDSVFDPQVFDLKSFSVSYDDKNLIFKFAFYGPIPNPWGSPNNLALQTLDVYVDKDPGAGMGARLLLPGRNAALAEGNGWDVAIWAEGWTPQILTPDPETGEPKQVTGASFKIIVDPAARLVTLRVPRAVFGEGDPASWGYVAAVLSQEGFPATGVWRVRDVEASASQWRFGGGPDDVNHTRIVDLAWPADAEPSQEAQLGEYPASNADLSTLTADDFPQVQLLFAR